MPFFDVYIAELNDPHFSWELGEWSRNVPRPISPFFPPANGREPLRTVIDNIKKGVFQGKQTDQNAWVARVTVDELKEFIYDFYGDINENKYHKEIWFLYNLIDRLSPERAYALVANQE